MAYLELFFTVIPIIALCSYSILLLFICISQKDRLIRSFMLVLTAMILWTASAVFMSIELYPGVLFWDRIMIVGMITVTFLLYYFVSIFTNTYNIYRAALWGLGTILFIVLNLLGYIVTDASVISHTVTLWGRQFDVVKFHYSLGLMAAPLYLYALAIIISTLLKARRSVNAKNDSPASGSIILVSNGITVVFIGTLCNLIPVLGQYPIDILACFINSFMLFIAIYKFRLVELRFMITRGLVYSFFIALLTVAYIFSVFFIENHLSGQYRSIIPYFTTLVALAVAVILQPLYKLSSKMVDKIFYRAEYNQRQALRQFSSRISNNLDLNGIAKELIEAVQHALNASHVLLLQRNDEKKHFKVFATSSQLYQPDLQISFENPVIKWMSKNNTGITREQLYYQPFFKSMWEQEKEQLYNAGIELIVPVRICDNITALLMLTRRKNNVAYTLDDLDLLTYLGASSAVAFENARLYTRSQADAITDSLTKLYNHRFFARLCPITLIKLVQQSYPC